jgi:exopolysaccharide biosynthesis polyprenyl glycosylphosphotransferase
MKTRLISVFLMFVLGFAGVRQLARLHAQRRSKIPYDQLISNGWLVAYVVLAIVVALSIGLPSSFLTAGRAFLASIGAAVFSMLFFSFLSVIFGDNGWLLPRPVVVVAPVVFVPIFWAVSLLSRSVWQSQSRRERILLIGSEADRYKMSIELDRSIHLPASLVEHLDLKSALSMKLADLERLVENSRISLIVANSEATENESLVDRVAKIHASGVRFRTLQLFYDQWLGKVPITEIGKLNLLHDVGEIHVDAYGRVKRVVDIVAGGICLLLIVPLYPIVLFMNLFGNRGPTFFAQPRVGLNGKPFRIYKLRSMVKSNDAAGEWTQTKDPRITAIGKLLRRSHIDELPQAINLLLGHISLIGPRPEQTHYVEVLSSKIPHYDVRHVIRPGLTGWAQVRYPYGSTEDDALEKLEYDLYYLRHQGLALDLSIVAKTIGHLLFIKGK